MTSTQTIPTSDESPPSVPPLSASARPGPLSLRDLYVPAGAAAALDAARVLADEEFMRAASRDARGETEG